MSQFNHFRALLLGALVLFSVICIVGCTDDEYVENVQQTETPTTNIRTIEEAIQIAQTAYDSFLGEDYPPSSRGSGIVDYSQPVQVILGNVSRTITKRDTLLYVVNFANEQGFAVIAANKMIEPLLAITEAGTYGEADDYDIPGFNLWMENAVNYVSEIEASSIIIGTPTFPTDSLDRLLQVKEWDEIIRSSFVDAQLPCNWGQGNGNTTNMSSSHCEGYLFENGLCGCATTAIAQVCALFSFPAALYERYPNSGPIYQFDWQLMRKHRIAIETTASNGQILIGAMCHEDSSEKIAAHTMVAQLCRIIGNYGHATEKVGATSMSATDMKGVAKSIFGSAHVSNDWENLEITMPCSSNSVYLVIGESQYEGESAHAWVCDGSRQTTYMHYLATRFDDYHDWEIKSSELRNSCLHHYNWGWDGRNNGWFGDVRPVLGGSKGYKNLMYLKVSNPQ